MARPTRITNEITELRAAIGMSQSELGHRVGVTRQTVNAIEGGKYSPSLEVAFKIARTLDVPLDRVFHYPEEASAG
jgi:putative transcriptional regulator